MNPQNRRDFLKMCVASAPALALAHGVKASDSTGMPAFRKPSELERYIDPLPVPRRPMPQSTGKDAVQYRVRMLEFTQQMHSQLPPTKLWGYEGQYPGPTFEALRGTPIIVQWENHLPPRHIFDIDLRIHGAMPPAPAVRTVPHLHGSRSTSDSDGLPEKWFAPGESALYHYPNSQAAATLWYHDHAVGITRLNVYAGLSGFFLLRDDEERSMDLPSGDYEIPLLLQDRTLDDQGQLVYSPTFDDGQKPPPHRWAPELFGDLPVVDGAIYPYLDVEPRRYRLRVLNGANARFFNLYFNLAKNPWEIPALVGFHQVGGDGGFLPAPTALSKLLLAPGERADLIVDFSALEGRIATLSNDAPAPYPDWDRINPHHSALNELMQFRVTIPLSRQRSSINLPPSRPHPRLSDSTSIAIREFILSEAIDGQGRSLGERIDGKAYSDPVTETMRLGSTEKWRFFNATKYAHPLHLHSIQFQILERQGVDQAALRNDIKRFAGNPRQPAPNEAGWKDTAIVHPWEALTILVRFDGPTGRYAFHSQLLEHADKEMMRPFEIVT
jgi:spore coat protein A